MTDTLNEVERHAVFKAAAASLPAFDMSGWVWTDQEVNILRKACAVRFDETLRTESLFHIASAALRIFLSRSQSLHPPAVKVDEGVRESIRAKVSRLSS